jgi:hypothetical protein
MVGFFGTVREQVPQSAQQEPVARQSQPQGYRPNMGMEAARRLKAGASSAAR